MLWILWPICQADVVSGAVFKLVEVNSLFDAIYWDIQVISWWLDTRDGIFEILILAV